MALFTSPKRQGGWQSMCTNWGAFPNGKYDDQADTTSQALDWVKEKYVRYWFVAYCRAEAEKLQKTNSKAQTFETCIGGNRGEDSVYGALGPHRRSGAQASAAGGTKTGGDTSISLLFPCSTLEPLRTRLVHWAAAEGR